MLRIQSSDQCFPTKPVGRVDHQAEVVRRGHVKALVHHLATNVSSTCIGSALLPARDGGATVGSLLAGRLAGKSKKRRCDRSVCTEFATQVGRDRKNDIEAVLGFQFSD